MNTLTQSLPLKNQIDNWSAKDDLFRVAVYESGQVQLTFDDTIAYQIGCYADNAPVAAVYGCDPVRQWLDISPAKNGNYLGKLKTTSDLATLPLMVRAQAKHAGLAPIKHSFVRCAGQIIGSDIARVFLPDTITPLAANSNVKKVDHVIAMPSKAKLLADKTDAELMLGFRNHRLALEERGHTLVVKDGVVMMRIHKDIAL